MRLSKETFQRKIHKAEVVTVILQMIILKKMRFYKTCTVKMRKKLAKNLKRSDLLKTNF